MNDQEKFWLGNFGNNYTKRSFNQKTILNNKIFFSKIFNNKKVNSILELGANVGYNILALKKVFKKLKLITCIEINNF
jgi:tRNA1(Val) A37 N6-methylase TrmN6